MNYQGSFAYDTCVVYIGFNNTGQFFYTYIYHAQLICKVLFKKWFKLVEIEVFIRTLNCYIYQSETQYSMGSVCLYIFLLFNLKHTSHCLGWKHTIFIPYTSTSQSPIPAKGLYPSGYGQ